MVGCDVKSVLTGCRSHRNMARVYLHMMRVSQMQVLYGLSMSVVLETVSRIDKARPQVKHNGDG